MSEPAAPPPRVALPEQQGRGWSFDPEYRPFLSAAALVLAGAAAAVLAGRARFEPHQVDHIRAVLDITTALCASAVFALCRAIWRQIGDRTALWAGTAALTVGVAAAARPEVAGAVLGRPPPDDGAMAGLSTAATVVASLLFAGGLVPHVRRIRIDAAWLTAGALGAVAWLAVALRSTDGGGLWLAVAHPTAGRSGIVVGDMIAVGVGLVLAIAYTVRGLQRRSLATWAGPMMVALALSALGATAADADNSWAVAAGVLEALGIIAGLVGCHLELTRAYEDQSVRLFDSALEAETAEVRERVRAADRSASRHDLVNAVTAIDGAALVLERGFERLSGSDREMLARVMGSGASRLRRLVSQDGPAGSRVSLSETAADVAEDGAGHPDLELDLRPDLVATGSPGETAEVVRQLIDYACRRAPGSPVTLRGERDGEWVVLRVEDRGPSMARELRRTVNGNESPRSPRQQDAIGLQVAARLMRGQGGDLWVEPRPGGGASFGICLPAVAAPDGDAGDDA